MASPVTITTTASVVVPVRTNRAKVIFQNVGSKPIYFKKQAINSAAVPPTTSNYDFILYPCNADDDDKTDKDEKTTCCECTAEIQSIASFMAVTASGTGTLAVMETRYVAL